MGWLPLGMKRFTPSEFISKASSRHNNSYDYSLVDYKNTKTPITIFCKTHNTKFVTTPMSHLNGTRCPICVREIPHTTDRLTHKLFMSKLLDVNKGKLNFEVLSRCQGADTKITLQDKYGTYEILARVLLRGAQPSLISATDKTANVINRFKEVHGEIYDYSKYKFTNARTMSTVVCKLHDEEFEINPNGHLSGNGCPICRYEKVAVINAETSTGWGLSRWSEVATTSKTFDSFKLYFLKLSDDKESFYKIGRTYRKLSERTYRLPYTCETLQLLEHSDPKIIFDLEAHLKRTFKIHKYTPLKKFNGMGECFQFDDPTIQSVLREMTLPSPSDIIPTSTK
jgi:hypothetical protein